MSSKRMIRFLKGVPPYNAREIASFDPNEAERYVSRGWAEDVVDHEDPPEVVKPDISPEGGDGASGEQDAEAKKDAAELGDREEAEEDTEAVVPDAASYAAWTVEMLRSELQDRKVDPDKIEGTGSGGNVVKADLVRALEALEPEGE